MKRTPSGDKQRELSLPPLPTPFGDAEITIERRPWWHLLKPLRWSVLYSDCTHTSEGLAYDRDDCMLARIAAAQLHSAHHERMWQAARGRPRG